jgi:hypothetical protein
MLFTIALTAAMATAVSAGPLASRDLPPSGSVSVTPHEQWSSSIGVVGCHFNTNRAAYWPATPGCDGMCVELSYQGRTLHVMHVDTSGGAHDISYDAWNTLVTGQSAADHPTQGGGVQMDYKVVDMSNCADILQGAGGKLPLMAANSMNYVAACSQQPNSWAAKNYALYNIANSQCEWGVDELCTVDLAAGQNQPTCPHQLGLTTPMPTSVWNFQYGTGAKVPALG